MSNDKQQAIAIAKQIGSFVLQYQEWLLSQYEKSDEHRQHKGTKGTLRQGYDLGVTYTYQDALVKWTELFREVVDNVE